MKLTAAFTAIALAFATLAAASPTPEQGFSVDPRANILDARKSCSGKRLDTEVCSGKKLQKQNSFHNCSNSGGKCCAKNADGSGGIDVKKGLGREDCGFCFGGKCG